MSQVNQFDSKNRKIASSWDRYLTNLAVYSKELMHLFLI